MYWGEKERVYKFSKTKKLDTEHSNTSKYILTKYAYYDMNTFICYKMIVIQNVLATFNIKYHIK